MGAIRLIVATLKESRAMRLIENARTTKIERLLEHTETIRQNEVGVKIGVIPNPDGFIARVEAAYAVKKFTASFTGPNPIDADELFQKPLSVYLNVANGTEGTTTIQGSHLNSEVVVAVARSTAATGNTASALLQEAPGKRAVRANFSGDPVKMTYEQQPPPKQVLADARTKYREVRHD